MRVNRLAVSIISIVLQARPKMISPAIDAASQFLYIVVYAVHTSITIYISRFAWSRIRFHSFFPGQTAVPAALRCESPSDALNRRLCVICSHMAPSSSGFTAYVVYVYICGNKLRGWTSSREWWRVCTALGHHHCRKPVSLLWLPKLATVPPSIYYILYTISA